MDRELERRIRSVYPKGVLWERDDAMLGADHQRLRVDQAMPALIPVGKSTWWAGVKSGCYPQPVRTLGVRITAWRVEDIRDLIQCCSVTEESWDRSDAQLQR